MKNKYKKYLSLFLSSMILTSNTLPVYATVNENQTVSEDSTKETLVQFNQSSTFLVTVPKTITLDHNKSSNYSVKVEGDIASDKSVYVAPIDGISETDEFDFYMKDQSTKNPKQDVPAKVTHNKMDWNFQEVSNGYEESTNEIIANDLTSGTWSGTFDFEINMHVLNEETPSFEELDDILMGNNETFQVEAILDGKNVTETANWSSNNENITVNKGLIETSALATIGDTATITVSKNNETKNIISESFQVTVIDIEFEKDSEKIEELQLYPSQTVTIKGKIVPQSDTANLKWSTTAPSGIAIVPNKNEVKIKIADDMPVGRTYSLLATCGTYSKLLPIEIIDKPDTHKHNYVETITKQPTCTQTGIKSLTCDCGDSYNEDLPALGHDMKDEVILPTCIQGGYIQHSCNRCDVNYQDSETPALGHNYIDGVCDRCGDKIAIMDWEYTLNDEDNTVLLKMYIGENPDVVVHDTYEFNGKTYKAIMDETHGGNVKTVFPQYITSVKFEKGVEFTTPDLQYMFYHLGNLETIDLSELDNIETLGDSALVTSASNTQSALTTVKLPKNLKTIGYSSLAYNEKLEHITIPDTVTKIETWAFGECGLTSISFPSNLTYIGSSAFKDNNFSEIIIPSNIEYVGSYAFANCSNLKNIQIEDPFNIEIYIDTFRNSKYEKDCIANNQPVIIDGILFGTVGVTSSGSYYNGYTIYVPEGVKILPNHLVSNSWVGLVGGHSKKIRTVRLPDSLEKVCNEAFFITIGTSEGGLGRPEPNGYINRIEYNGTLDLNNHPSAPNAKVYTY